jgi:hypothetical protein
VDVVDYLGVVIATDTRLAQPAVDGPEDLLSTVSFTMADLS